MEIRLRISPVYLYLVTPSDKSFLLWKRILWCIIWFSLWKWTFILYDSCDPRGAPAPFHFMVGGFRVDVVNLKHSCCLYSRTQTSPKPIIYVDIWIYNFMIIGQPWILLQFTNLWSAWHHRASAHYRRRLTQYRATAIALIKTQTNNILMNLATHLVRTQFVLSVYKKRHRFAVGQSFRHITII